MYNGYSIIGLRGEKNQAGVVGPWCSWHLVSHFVDMLTDLATTNIPNTKLRPDLGGIQLAELNFRTRLVELLRTVPENDTPFTFDEAFQQALLENQSLFHCTAAHVAAVRSAGNPSPAARDSFAGNRGRDEGKHPYKKHRNNDYARGSGNGNMQWPRRDQGKY